jgi:catechol 2,3-dioxygenase-like lactoylglutathione lyase family enzyme
MAATPTGVSIRAISLDCDDPRALIGFWAALLGAEVGFESDDFCAIRLEACWLTAIRIEGHRPATWPEGTQPKQFHLDLDVDDLAATEELARSLGATKPDFQPGEDRFVVLTDPAGHPFCLTTQIPD